MARCWIFQANPKIFDIIGELEDSDELSHWTIRQHQDDVKYGDTAFIWKADAGEGNAGIYAVAKVISEVVPLPVIWGDEYWRNRADRRDPCGEPCPGPDKRSGQNGLYPVSCTHINNEAAVKNQRDDNREHQFFKGCHGGFV